MSSVKMFRALVLVSAIAFANGSSAAVIGLTFEGLQDFEPIANFYNGGFGGNGSGPGPSYGITFSNAVGWIDSDNGGTGNFGGEPSPSTALWFIPAQMPPFSEIMNVPAGFNTGFSFFYSSPFLVDSSNYVFRIFDGLDGTGTVLSSFTLPQTPNTGAPDPTGAFSPFLPFGVTFAGTARSVEFAAFGEMTFDNVTLGSSAPIPEPSSLMLAGLAFGFIISCRVGKRRAATLRHRFPGGNKGGNKGAASHYGRCRKTLLAQAFA
jgi:hypothetical protein